METTEGARLETNFAKIFALDLVIHVARFILRNVAASAASRKLATSLSLRNQLFLLSQASKGTDGNHETTTTCTATASLGSELEQ